MEWQELAGSQRIKEMKSAIRLLCYWQKSTFRLPLLENPSAFNQEKERIAALLVDNHLGKLARKVRLLGEDGGLDSDSFLDDWAEIIFFTSLWTRFDKLSAGLKLNLIYQSGPNITKKHLIKEKPFKDRFLVVGRNFSMEERLLRRTVYCYASEQKRFYMVLDYSFNQQPFDRIYQVGEVYEGESVSYPFPGSLRISPEKWKRADHDFSPLQGIVVKSMPEAVRSYSHAMKTNPFCEPWPAVVPVTTRYDNGDWTVMDVDGNRIRMAHSEIHQYAAFYAASYGSPVPVAMLLSRSGILPLSYSNGENFIELVQNRD